MPKPVQPLIVSDLFFGLAAVLLIVLALLSSQIAPLMQRAGKPDADPQFLRSATPALAAHKGGVRHLMLLDAQGVMMTAAAQNGDTVTDAIPLDEMLGSAPLLQGLHAEPLVLIAPDGLEAAFLLSSRAASEGVATLTTYRLPQGCRQLIWRGAEQLRCLF